MPELEEADYRKFDEILADWEYSRGSYKSACKRNFTNFVKRLAVRCGAVSARESLLCYVRLLQLENLSSEVLEIARQRLSYVPGGLHLENGIGYGWLAEYQVQAIRLPIKRDWLGLFVCFKGCYKDVDKWQSMGFWVAEPLPMVRHGWEWLVTHNVEDAGYAVAINLPVVRWQNPYRLEVVANYRDIGYWKAYKTWGGCREWYKKKGLYLTSESGEAIAGCNESEQNRGSISDLAVQKQKLENLLADGG